MYLGTRGFGFERPRPSALWCASVEGPEVTSHPIESHDGTVVVLHEFGGSGTPLIICHATGFHARAYLPLVASWTSKYSVWGLDLRGHGASQIDAEATFDWSDFTHDLLAAVDRIGDPVQAFGHSMGGATTLLAEAARPGSIRAAWLYEPILFPEGIEPNRNSMMAENAARRRNTFGSRAEALARYAARPPLNLMRADALAAYVEYGFVDEPSEPDGTVRLACRPVHEAMTFAGATITASRVSGVTIPVTVAQGVVLRDQPSAADFATGTATALANGSLATYDDLTHFGPLEAPTRIANDVIAAFDAV